MHHDDLDDVILNHNLWHGYMDLGPPSKLCNKYGDTMLNEERNNKSCPRKTPRFLSAVRMEMFNQVFVYSAALKRKGHESSDSDVGIGNMYHDNLDDIILNHNLLRGYMDLGPPSKLCNKCGDTMWNEERNNKSCPRKTPCFLSALYIYDTQNEVENGINAMGGASDNVDPDIVEELLSMLDKNGELVKAFRMARNQFENEDLEKFKLVIISSQSSSGRPNHIVAFIVSDDMDTGGFRGTVVNSKQEGLKRIYETDPLFMQLQYPLLFHWGTEGLTPHLAGSLWQQYVVDQFATIEQYRLDWVSTHQTTIRAYLYHSVRDALSKGDHYPMHVGKAIYCLLHSLDLSDTCLNTLRTLWRYVVKLKHGLPHVYMLISLNPESRPNSIEKVDQLVSAEIPDKNSDPIAYEAVKNYMMHGPCDLMVIPILTIMDFLFIGGVTLCHINLEICNSSRSLKYLFKYCLKGHGTATVLLKKKSNKSGNEQTARSVKNLDEDKNFLEGRYVFASEASWRIFGFDIHHHSLSVDHLPIHFPDYKYLDFQSSMDLENVCNNMTSKNSKLEAWFVANSEFPQAQNFTYSDFPTHFTWIKKNAKWKLRQRGDVVGRLAEVHATTGELLYIRMLLLRCKCALSFTQLRTIDGTTYDRLKEAYGSLGLLNNDKQWYEALEKNAF
ncbi:uncharacterized protein LOC141665605 [Apium graveolens]|uniref:uncharacterized protein LOC141665605 n=1 Tax=Apium graveolens TaxID=4045 RepID=UPI003D78BE2F